MKAALVEAFAHQLEAQMALTDDMPPESETQVACSLEQLRHFVHYMRTLHADYLQYKEQVDMLNARTNHVRHTADIGWRPNLDPQLKLDL